MSLKQRTRQAVSNALVARRNIGMRDVARVAGVATMTVSRVLAGAANVTPETHARVLAAVEELGYLPNRLARDFGSSRTALIGVIVPTISNLMFADKIEALVEVFRPNGYQILATHSGYSLETEYKLVQALVAQRVSGVVLTGTMHDPRTVDLLIRSGIPVVETWNLPATPIDMSVGFSNHDAASAMVHHLAALGYRRIALVHPHLDANDRARDRLHGYRAAMRHLDLPWGPELERASGFGFASGAKMLADLLENVGGLEAIFFGNDSLAIGALLECRRRGIRVPEQLGIAGFDDVDLAPQLDPSLTTVRIPMGEIGHRAGTLLLQQIKGEPLEKRAIDLGFEIIDRQSTRRLT